MRPLPLRAPRAFKGTSKTLAFILFLPFVLLCCASTAQADPIVITGGFGGTSLGIGNMFLSVTAPGFSFSAANTSAPKPQLCGLCRPGTTFGGVVSTSTDLPIELIYNGVVYKQNTLGEYIVRGGGTFTFGPLTIPVDLSPVSTTFTFVGGVSATLFNPPNPTSPPDPLILQMTGSGIVTFTFVQVGSNIRSQGTFTFAPPQPAPEPATLVLLGTGLAGAVAAKVRRRRRE